MSKAQSAQGPPTAYVQFREDGWPLCPGCDEDELWSPATPATIETISSCLRCGWRPRRKARDTFTSTVAAAAAYERLHGGHP